MPGRVRASDIEELKARVNIADIIGEYVALRPASAGSLKGLCPFHSEKSPSFNVRSNPGFYHCFGCGAGGDVFKFLQEIESLSFADAVERLANRIGFELHYEDGGPEVGARTRLLAANQAASDYFSKQLTEDEAVTAREFIIQRGFSPADALRFSIGYAPKGWSNLTTTLKSQGFTETELLEAGLAARGEKGIYDKFRGRLIWPIRDANGQVLGFGARKLYESDEGPKYLNTSDTPVYHKSTVLYGLDLARKQIAKTRQIIVVEGYTDVMACHLAGFENAVATCGTAFGEEHIKVINRIFGQTSAEPAEVIFTFDPDAAGQKAALRVYSDSHKFNALTFVAVGPDGLDPADLRQQRGGEAVASMLAGKRPLFEFVIRHRISKFDLNDISSRVAAARVAAQVVADLSDPAMQSAYTRLLADLVSLEVSEVSQIVSQVKAGNRNQAVNALRIPNQDGNVPSRSLQTSAAGWSNVGQVPASNQFDRRERMLLEVVVQQSNLLALDQLKRIESAGLQSSELQSILHAAVESTAFGSVAELYAALMEQLGSGYELLLRELITAELPVSSQEEIEKYCAGVMGASLVAAMSREKSDLLQVLRRLDPVSQALEIQMVQQQLVELEQERRKFIG